MDALARREHSRFELEQKLTRAGFDDAVIEVTLDQLVDDRLLCNTRFAQSFISSRVRSGKGPRRIQADLRQRGLGDADISAAMAAADVDWSALALEVCQRKFGHAPARDFNELAKRARFLAYRGFDSETARSIASTGSSVE
ncbi:MAG: regulatory protein RecX [Pseudomonadota bacterium]